MLVKRRAGSAQRSSLASTLTRRRQCHRPDGPPEFPPQLRPGGGRHGRLGSLAARHREEGRGRSRRSRYRGDAAQEHLHPLLGRLHGHRRGPERRLDRPGAGLGQPDQPGHALRQGRFGARADQGRAPQQVSGEAGERRVEADHLGSGDRGDRRQAAGDPREVRAGQRVLAGLGQVLQRGSLPVPQVRGPVGDQHGRPPGPHLPFHHGRRRRQYMGLRRHDQQLQRHPERQGADDHRRQPGRGASGVDAAHAARQGA